MDKFILVLILAIVQGIGEFLPISSSGHLLLVMDLHKSLGFGEIEEPLTLGILLHFGTLLSVFVVFRKRIWDILSNDRRLLLLVVLGSVPAAIVGLGLKGIGLDDAAKNTLVAGFCFIITGFLLLRMRSKSNGLGETKSMSFKQTGIIGCMQAFAILPGISRSGSTIAAGMETGLRRGEAASFSFLLSIPVIAGAAFVEMLSMAVKLYKNDAAVTQKATEIGIPLLIFGTLLTFVIGVVALKWLLKWLEEGKLHYFAYYLFILGPAVIIWKLI